MDKQKMKIGVVGAGAVGGVMAVLLSAKGYDVELVYRHMQKDKLIDSFVPFEISGVMGEISYLVKSVPSVSEFSSPKDYIFILTRGEHVVSVAEESLLHLKTDGKIVINSNIWTIDDCIKKVPQGVIVGMFNSWASERLASTSMRVHKNGVFVIGMFAEKNKANLCVLKEVLDDISPTSIQDNMYGFMSSRMIINAAVSAMGAISGLKLGKMLTNKYGKQLFIGLVNEGVKVFKGMKIEIPPYAGKLNFDLFAKKTIIHHFYREKIINLIIKNNYYLLSSVLIDLQKGIKTEIEFLTGKIVLLAKRVGVTVPLNERITELVKEIELHERSIYEDNFEEVLKNKQKNGEKQ